MSGIIAIEDVEFEKLGSDFKRPGDIKVSICCASYNCAEYIRDAIEGFMNQKTDYKYEILLFDDASNDGTIDIIKSYIGKYPKHIRGYIAKNNYYNHPNRKVITKSLRMNESHGMYIALCEADDYWTDPKKIQKQVDFMEANSRCSMVTSAYWWIDCRNNKKEIVRLADLDRYLSPSDVICKPRGHLATASLLIRRDAFFLPKDFPKADVGDIRYHYNALDHGDVYYFDEPMCVYRYNRPGSWSSKQQDPVQHIVHNVHMAEFYGQFDTYSKGKYTKELQERYSSVMLDASRAYKRLNYIERNQVREALGGKLLSVHQLDMQTFIYGAGDFGKRLFRWIKDEDLCNIEGFVQTRVSDAENTCESLPVFDIDYLLHCKGQKRFLLAINNKEDVREIRANILMNWAHEVIDCSGFIRDNLVPAKPLGFCVLCGNYVKKYERNEIIPSELYKRFHVIGGGERENCICPHCHSNDRFRWVFYALKNHTNIWKETSSILHFAPEPQIAEKLKKVGKHCQYVTADIAGNGVDIACDIRDIPFKDKNFDYVIANHVLEHIDNEAKAVFECLRVLKDSGTLVLSFPVCMDIATLESSEDETSLERIAKYGQEDHVRLYGKDFKARIERYGFKVTVYSPQRLLVQSDIERFGFIPDDILLFCKKDSTAVGVRTGSEVESKIVGNNIP